jgi:glycosyltransferase involved in cell wall biosynthesis
VIVRPCAVVPTYDNPATIRNVVLAIREYLADVIVVDDGSGPEAREACRQLVADGLAHVRFRDENGGKGAAVKTGIEIARELGFTHVLQMDADEQHDPDDIPHFLGEARLRPDALILGSPVFDDTAPTIRLLGRKITRFWTHVQTGGRVIDDPMCGFRLYPVGPTSAVRVRGNAMDFDPEVAVKLHWRGTPIVNLPTRVRYSAGGVSHFRQFTDNLLLAWMHTRLCCLALWRLIHPRSRRALPDGA